ncbi:fumarylacetoacetate hydrolase family protein [Variovorax sp. J22R133]|uniref:fumarylacetoacetate hydrolase family protein n=1 Tax=Variovorax brevis TaxID=3053503 RepID=UPI002576A2F3|nr:fumarylacetoacetate hydrolase family protein [Variovorax sp. J22R133]MDM0117353.1 fumarylacetoacetate hydrolase family protein [Variovorax sp. J22R133]
MRFVTFKHRDSEAPRLALRTPTGLRALSAAHADRFPQDLQALIQSGVAALREAAIAMEQYGVPVELEGIEYLPPVPAPQKIICVGLNYLDHTRESKFEQPAYPTLFLRTAASFVGYEQPIVRPLCSDQFDYEGELAVFIGKPGRHIRKASALDHVAGYSVSNEGSVRDYQFKSPQWTVGKNFDRSGSIGPDFVSADELPPGGAGLRIETRLNGETVQSANTSEMVFDTATVISLVSEAMALHAGDVILMGTPAGVGLARTPPLFMHHGDVVEVEIEGVGLIRNRVADEVQ